MKNNKPRFVIGRGDVIGKTDPVEQYVIDNGYHFLFENENVYIIRACMFGFDVIIFKSSPDATELAALIENKATNEEVYELINQKLIRKAPFYKIFTAYVIERSDTFIRGKRSKVNQLKKALEMDDVGILKIFETDDNENFTE